MQARRNKKFLNASEIIITRGEWAAIYLVNLYCECPCKSHKQKNNGLGDIKWNLRSVEFIYLVPAPNFWDTYTKSFDF